MSKFYVESDGRVYLVKKENTLTFPEKRKEMPFHICPRAEMMVKNERIIYSQPLISFHPRKWMKKENVPLLENVDPIVRKAVNFSLPRVVVEAIIKKEKQVLLVKPSRGYNKNCWTLPGGFLVYAETPQEALRRELKEEISVLPHSTTLIHLHSAIGEGNSYQWILLYFQADISNKLDEIKPNHEIKQLKWFGKTEAIKAINSPLMREGYRQAIGKI